MESTDILTSTLSVIQFVLIASISIIIYMILLSRVLARHALPISYRTDSILGRGLHRFRYPEGRAVLYEPHPSLRKYIRRYLLFTVEGYKNLRLRLDGAVNTLNLTVIMYDNRDCVIDVADASVTSNGAKYSMPIALDSRTSYVALVLNSVNGIQKEKKPYMEMRAKSLIMYFILASVTTFATFSLILTSLVIMLEGLGNYSPFSISYPFFILPSLIIGAASLGIILAVRVGKGVKVVLR